MQSFYFKDVEHLLQNSELFLKDAELLLQRCGISSSKMQTPASNDVNFCFKDAEFLI